MRRHEPALLLNALRDYGTGTWEGGDPACSHKGSNGQQLSKSKATTRGGGHSAAETGPAPFRNSCPRCGAVRVDRQIGLEETPGAYVTKMVEVFREVRRVLAASGVLWCNIGDSYASKGGTTNRANSGKQLTNAASREVHRPYAGGVKNLQGIPWKLAFALQEDGWILRSEVTLCKTSPMPESVRDRPTQATEKLFLLTKEERYYYDQEAERVPWADDRLGASGVEQCKYSAPSGRNGDTGLGKPPPFPGRNLWNYWAWSTEPYPEAHFATFPPWLPRRCIRLGSSEYGVCPKCSAPWQRILERSKAKRVRPNDHVKRTGESGTGNSCANTVAGVAVRSKGWEPGCKCGHTETVPALILDPFSGAGTTVMVANQLGRRAIGFELNPEYTKLSRRRIANASLVKDESLPGPPLPLFGED